MSDREPRTGTLDAGHRRAPKKKPGRSARTAATKGEGGRLRGGRAGKGGLVKIRGAVSKPWGALRAVGGKAWGVWDRGYDNAVARPVHAVKVFAIITSALVLVAGLCWFGSYHYASLDTAAADVTTQGEDAIGRLMSYNFRTVDRQVEKTQDLVTGGFKDQYAKFINTTITPGAKDKEVEVQTTVDRSSIVSNSTSEAVMLMIVNQDYETLANPDGDSTSSAVRVKLEKVDGKWKVSELTPV